MKKFYKIALTLLVGVLTGLTAMAADVKVGSLYYTVNTGTKTATVARNAEYKNLTTVVIPGKITVDNVEYTVTAVAQQAFQECTELTSVSFEPGVKEVGKWAFWKCSGIKTLVLPSTLEKVLDSGFSKCSSVEELVLPDNLTSIGSFGFGTMSSLRKLTLPANMKEIKNNAFSYCSSLKELNLNTGISIIGGSAFYASGLETLFVPTNVDIIDDSAFSNNTLLRTVTGCQGLSMIGGGSFFKCSSLESISLPDGLSSIGENVFYECASLKSINISPKVTALSAYAFYGCSSLTEVAWPQNVKTMGKATFYGCTSLKKIDLPADMTQIGEMAFQGCSSLESVTIPTALEVISDGLFNRCSSLRQITVPANVTYIGESAFSGTAIAQLDIPAAVTSIGGNIVTACPNLLRIKVAEANSNYCDIDGVLFNKAKTMLLQYPAGRKGEYVMPDGVETIASGAFMSNAALTGITFPKSLKSIGRSAFMSANGLTRVILPQALENLDMTSFFFASNIREFILPNTNLSIGSNALSATGMSRMIFPETIGRIGISGNESFSIMTQNPNLEWVSLPSSLREFSPLGLNCAKLSTIYSFAATPAEIKGQNAVTGRITIKVPKGSAAAYKAAWSKLYTNATFEEVLPTGAVVNMSGADATLSWEPFSDANLAAPVRYELVLRQGENVVSTVELSGEKAQGNNLSHVWNGLEKKVYSYELRGFQQTGEMSLRYAGEFDMNNSGISDIEIDGDNAPVEYYDLMGRRVMNPAKGQMLIKRQGDKAKKVVF